MSKEKDQGSVDLIDIASLLGQDIGSEPTLPIEGLNKPADLAHELDQPNPETVEDVPGDKISSLTDIINKEEVVNDDELLLDGEKQKNITNTTSEQFRTSLKNLFSIEKIVQEVNGEEVEVSIDEVDIDQETFEMIAKQALENQKEELNKDKISVKGVSDFTKSLIEIDKNGGNVSQLLKVKEAISDPLDQLDLTQRQDQIDAIYLRKKAQGQADDEINILIKGYEAEGLLEEKAIQAESELREAVNKQVELAKEQAENAAKEREERMKSYKKDLKQVLGTKFQLNDTSLTKIVDLSTKKGKNGRFEIDNAFTQAMSDPEVASDLVLLLFDRDEYIKQVTNKKVIESKLETAKTIKIIRSNSGGTSGSDPSRSKKDDLIDISTLR